MSKGHCNRFYESKAQAETHLYDMRAEEVHWPVPVESCGTAATSEGCLSTSLTSMAPESQNVLSISPIQEDHLSLDGIITDSSWKLVAADGLSAALAVLPKEQISVVVCERDLLPGAWTDLLEHLKYLPHAPGLIVTSTHADERLWAEALNRGAWDVLAKPFERTEVLRTIGLALHHWHNERHPKKSGSS